MGTKGHLLWWSVLGFVNFLVISQTAGEKLVLDVNSDQTKEWFEINCLYNNDHEDFNHYACPAGILQGEDVFPTRSGFWSPCEVQTCEIYYFGGNTAPQPKSITVGAYANGSPEILVSSMYGPLGTGYKQIGKASFSEARGWYNTTLDLGEEKRALQLKITLVTNPSTKDFLLLDYIVIDLGETGSLPTDPPPTTTVIPIVNDLVSLDKQSDSWVVWKSECGYAESLSEFGVYGCNSQSKINNPNNSTGYWSSCEKRSCSVRYVAKPDYILQPAVSDTSVMAYVTEDAEINIKLKTNLLDFTCKNCRILHTITSEDSGGNWVEKNFELELIRSENFALVFELRNGVNGGIAILDKVEVKLRSQEPPTGGDGGDNGSDNNENGGSMKMEAQIVLILSLAFMTKLYNNI